MAIQTITESEMRAQGVVSLPTRPNADPSGGGENLSAAALKERFDRLPRYIAGRLNEVIDAILTSPADPQAGDGAIGHLIRTGLHPTSDPDHSLCDFFDDLSDGTLSGYLSVGGESLSENLAGKEDTLRVEGNASTDLILCDRREYRLGEIEELNITLPENPTSTFSAALVFDTGEGNGDSSVSYPESIKWTGDDIVSRRFVLFGGRHYTVFLWYDGGWQGNVRGVDL